MNRAVRRQLVLEDVSRERDRQAAMWADPHAWGIGDCSSPDVDLPVKVAVLLEEAGEVARAVLDRDDAHLRTELVQLAAVVVAIIEGIDT